jgi:hypothetical protein
MSNELVVNADWEASWAIGVYLKANGDDVAINNSLSMFGF